MTDTNSPEGNDRRGLDATEADEQSDGLAPGDRETGDPSDPVEPDTTSGGAPEPADTDDPAAFGK